MNSKYLFIMVCLVLLQIVSSRPQSKNVDLGPEETEPEKKVRGKRKYDIPLLKQLEEGGVGVKHLVDDDNKEGIKIEIVGKTQDTIKKVIEETQPPDVPPMENQPNGNRVKKQSPNNVCIKVGGCGKTVCGPIISARGAVANDMRAMIQGAKPMMSLSGELSSALKDMPDLGSKVDQMHPVQGRTIDLMGITPVSLGSLGYGTPAIYSSVPASAPLSTEGSTLNFGHSFFKPPTIPTIPVAVVSQHSSHPAIHPWVLSHLMPHIMPHLMSSISSYIPHRFEPQVIQNEIKQPVPVIPYPQPSYVNADNTLLCQPFRNQRLDIPYEYIYKPDLAIDKSLNVSEASKKSQSGLSPAEEERRIQEHLRKVNEIKDEISQLNRAAQRIVDQQERLTEMQQKQIYSGIGPSSTQTTSQMATPYMGAGYYAHPGMPWGYSRSNILSFPNSHDDIDFFVNLLRAGKKIGLISDSFQPSMLSPVGDALKGASGESNTQKDTTNAMNDSTKNTDNKSNVKTEKKAK